MKWLRNREVSRILLLQVLLSSASVTAAWVWNIRFGLFTLGLSILFVGIWAASTFQRYRQLSAMAAELDRILHSRDRQVLIAGQQEGELGILQSEITKMTFRLLEQKERLQEDKVYLAALIADISHQVRTPLTTMNLLVSFLEEEDLAEERRREIAYELLGLLSRMDWLITALLRLSKLDTGAVCFQQQTMETEKLLRHAVEALLIPMELRGQNLVIHSDGMFTGDGEWTAEAIGNIVKNCVEHTPAGGTVCLTARENALYTEIRIEDTGSGIDPEDLPHIFERFYRGKNTNDQNFGIGLALAKAIITAQNGTVKVENREPCGTRFLIRFYRSTV